MLRPVKTVDGATPPSSPLETVGQVSLPSYERGPAGSSSSTQRTEYERDELGTVVNKVTVVTTTVTTRERYRVTEDA
jgi:hypothetical protein